MSETPVESALPPRDGDAPLHELTRDQLSAYLLLCFQDDELLQLARAAKVRVTGGYRLESLGGVERADLLADEIRAVPEARKPVVELLRKLYEFPALDAVALPKVVGEELAALAVEGDAPQRMIWRLLADPSAELRKAAGVALEPLADELLGPAEETGPDAPATAATGAAPAPGEAPDTRELRKEARRASALAERTREKAANLKEQLKSARTEVTRLERESAARAKESARLHGELEKTREKLQQAKQKTRADERERLEKERAELAARVATLEERAKTLAAERDGLRERLEAATRQLAEKRPAGPDPARDEEVEPAQQELPSTWLLPRFTREFYDSLERWELRIQRAAFKQAFLLAENHRHPSLRAIPLEGIPGYYRVRIATDVRLIYRRLENSREVEILSLIDREDLDRYVRQAKTR